MTAAEINALPPRVRSYIMDLETSHGNEAHIIQDNFRLSEENEQLRALVTEMVREKDEASA